MKTIKSFTIDHDTHYEGIYLSGVNNNIYTYDLRFKRPNCGDYLSNEALHSIEHMFATVIRNSDIQDKVVYFGPMGCRTGFYLLLLGIDKEIATKYILDGMKKSLELDEVPGCEKKQCGNYKEHSLSEAKKEIENWLAKIEN